MAVGFCLVVLCTSSLMSQDCWLILRYAALQSDVDHKPIGCDTIQLLSNCDMLQDVSGCSIVYKIVPVLKPVSCLQNLSEP